MKKVIELRGVTKQFDGETVLDSIDLDIYDNEFLTLLGPSGCGKTTTLRTITGFIEPAEGSVVVKGRDITRVPIEDRNIGIVFQSYALFPTMTVYDNIAFGLKVQKVDRKTIASRVAELIDLIGLKGLEKRYPSQLSGGQRQRVAFARALAPNPQVLLLDEHTAALDPKTAAKVLALTDKIIKENSLTAMMVTHNMRDAIAHGNRLIMMNNGQVVLNISGEEKKNLTVEDLLMKFEEVSGEEFASDKALLG